MDNDYEEWLEARRYTEPDEELEYILTVEELINLTEETA